MTISNQVDILLFKHRMIHRSLVLELCQAKNMQECTLHQRKKKSRNERFGKYFWMMIPVQSFNLSLFSIDHTFGIQKIPSQTNNSTAVSQILMQGVSGRTKRRKHRGRCRASTALEKRQWRSGPLVPVCMYTATTV